MPEVAHKIKFFIGIIALLLFYSKYLNESYHSLDKDKKEATDHEK